MIVVSVVVTASLAAGCGAADTLDVNRAEKVIREDITAKAGAQLRSVDCPASIEVKKSGMFKVIGTDGSTLTIRARQVDDDQRVFFDYRVLLRTQIVERFVERESGSDVVCPALVKARRGVRFTCRVTDQRGTDRAVALTVVNNEGMVEVDR